MKKNDFILIGGIIVIALAFFLLVEAKKADKNPDWVVVTVGGTEYGRYSLQEDGVYEIEAHEGEENVLVIKDGTAEVTDANCADKLCVHQKEISLNGEMIVCLPHQVIIKVESAQDSAKDAVSN